MFFPLPHRVAQKGTKTNKELTIVLPAYTTTEKVQEILQVITPLKEIIPRSLIVKDIAKRKDFLPRNYGQYWNILNKLFVTVEMELVKLAIVLPGFNHFF